MIKNVVFDLGRVIYTYNPRQDLLNQGFSEEAADLFMARVYDSDTWIELDRGTYTLSEAVSNWIAKFPDIAEDLRRVFDNGWVDRIIKIMPDSLDFFYEVKQRGFKVYILTNIMEDTFTHVRARDPFFDDADGLIVSAHEKLIKPDHSIYHCLLNRYNLIPGETIFIDDLPQNIAAAKEVGIRGIQFTNLEDVKYQFNEMVTC